MKIETHNSFDTLFSSISHINRLKSILLIIEFYLLGKRRVVASDVSRSDKGIFARVSQTNQTQ